MTKTYEACLMSFTSENKGEDPSKGGFKSQGEAFEYIKKQCPLHMNQMDDEEDYKVGFCRNCEAEWTIFEEKVIPM